MRLLLKNDIGFISPSVIFHHYVRYSNVLDRTSTNLDRCYIFGTQIQPLRSHWLIILSFSSFLYLTTENIVRYSNVPWASAGVVRDPIATFLK